jgi:hypothetical protein
MGTEMKTENDSQSGLKAAFVMPKLTADWMVSLSSSGCVASRILVCVVGATRFDLEEHQIVVVGWWRLKGSAFSTWFVPKRPNRKVSSMQAQPAARHAAAAPRHMPACGRSSIPDRCYYPANGPRTHHSSPEQQGSTSAL